MSATLDSSDPSGPFDKHPDRVLEARHALNEDQRSPEEMIGLRVLVCGGRDYDDAVTVGSWLGAIQRDHGILCIIEGGARGADTLARKYAEFRSIKCETYRADWEGFRAIGNVAAAGPARNRKMLQEGKPDLVVAFPGGRGTENMIRQAENAKVRVMRITTPVQP